MTKHHDRKSEIRERMKRTGEKHTTAKRMLETRPRLMLPLRFAPTGHQCPPCGGSGVGGWYDFATPDANAVMVCPALCVHCHGCGWYDHAGCDPHDHDDPEDWGYDPDAWDDDDVEAEERCFSCRGRRSWLMQGFDEENVYTLRVPCGCSAELLVAAP